MKRKVIAVLAIVTFVFFFSPRWGITGCYRAFGAGYSYSRSGEKIAKLTDPWEDGRHTPYQTEYGWKPSVFWMLTQSQLSIFDELKTCEGK
jgi:hypothetical protein